MGKGKAKQQTNKTKTKNISTILERKIDPNTSPLEREWKHSNAVTK